MPPLLPIVVAVSLRVPFAGGPPADAWTGPDKVKHFFASAFVQSVGYGALRTVGAGHGTALAGASAGTLAVGLAREVHDRRAGRVFSIRDLVWDAAGAGAASVVLAQTRR